MSLASKITRKIECICDPIISSHGLELVHVNYRRETQGWVLRILVDRLVGGVTIEDCQALSLELSDVLDVEESISNAYHLEVSSAGVERPLVKHEDFVRFAGRQIKLSVRHPVKGKRNFFVTLIGLEEEVVIVQDAEGMHYEIDYTNIIRAHLIVDTTSLFSKSGK